MSSRSKIIISTTFTIFMLCIVLWYIINSESPERKIWKLPNNLNAYLPEIKTKNDTLLQYAGFMVSLNRTSKLASMVLYKLRRIDLENKKAERKNNFKSDPGLRDYVIASKHYAKSGYDRGHLAPCEDLMSSQEKVDQSFYMSNIAAQVPRFNRGIWKSLENQVRNYAIENDSIIVITGPYHPTPDLNKPELPVPEFYYKVILDISPPEYKAVAYLMKNDTSRGELKEYVISIDSLEAYLGYDFFYQLDPELQEMIED